MNESSVILLDEMALPNQDIDWFATQTDITMLTAFGSMERTEAQWHNLLESVDLKVQGIFTYTYSHRLSIIAATLWQREIFEDRDKGFLFFRIGKSISCDQNFIEVNVKETARPTVTQ